MENHLDYLPVVDKDQQIRNLRDQLQKSTILISEMRYELGLGTSDLRKRAGEQVERNMKLI